MGQNIKTYYKPTSSAYVKTDDEIVDAHMDRRGLNRQLRAEQSSPVGKIKSAVTRAGGRVKEWMEAHPHNRRDPPERSEPRTHRQPTRGRTPSRVDKYQDGKVVETIYFGTDEKIPRRQKPRRQPRPKDPMGGMGSGLDMRDFLPANMGLGQAMGYENPYTKPRKTKGKKYGGSWMDPGYIPPELRDFF